jgi:hypothetical protein
MYIGHYKSVRSNNEFYSKVNQNLIFPTQVEHKGERYLLFETHIASTPTQIKNIYSRAKELGIPFDVSLG